MSLLKSHGSIILWEMCVLESFVIWSLIYGMRSRLLACVGMYMCIIRSGLLVIWKASRYGAMLLGVGILVILSAE